MELKATGDYASMPRVSIIIPTFNCAGFISRALESAFAQTYTDYEVIVADDGSTDETRDLVARWYGKIRYLYQANRGVSAARNLAVSKASGEFLAYLDADDMWYPHKLEQQVAFLDAHPEYGLVHSDLTIVDDNDRVIVQDFNRETGRSVPRGQCVTDLLCNGHIQIASVVERRICYDRAGGFDERLGFHEDYLQWIQVALHGYAVGYIDEPLAMYRRRTDSASTNHAKMAEGIIQMYRILLEENALLERLGTAAEAEVHRRLAVMQRHLPYLYRCQGRNDLARRQAAALIRECPRELGSYIELMKSCMPIPLACGLRRLRELVV